MFQEHLLHQSPLDVDLIVKHIGRQALIASIPFEIINNKSFHYNYLNRVSSGFSKIMLEAIKKNYFSEILLMNKNDGGISNFPIDIINHINQLNSDLPLIAFGSIDNFNSMQNLLANERVSAIAIGNSLNYKESNIYRIKSNLYNVSLRPYITST